MTSELHELVVRRDGQCFLARYPGHVCSDLAGPHAAGDLRRLTVDHVHMGGVGMMGKRPKHLPRNLVAMCWSGNVGCPSHAVREDERAYLLEFYGP